MIFDSELRVFGARTATVVEKADAAFTGVEEKNGRIVAIVGGHGDLGEALHRVVVGRE